MGTTNRVYVKSTAHLKEAAQKLAGASRYFIDTEFDMAGPSKKLCLIQVSTGNDELYLIDTLALAALESLRDVLFRPDAEWVVHAGNYDVALLQEAMRSGSHPRLFDTQVAWGLLGAEYPVSLAYLLYRLLGVRSAKSEQASAWAARPLSPEQLEYAASDIEQLPALRALLAERLEKAGRGALIFEASGESILPEPVEPLSLDEYRNAWQLDAPGQAVLQHLIEGWNALQPDERAEAPHPRNFLTIAKLLPESGAELGKIRGISFSWVKRHGDSFAGKLMRVSAAASREGFVPLEPPPYNTFEKVLAGGWIRKAVAETCAQLSIAPELAFPERLIRRMIEAVETRNARDAVGEVLTGWRAQALKETILMHSREQRS